MERIVFLYCWWIFVKKEIIKEFLAGDAINITGQLHDESSALERRHLINTAADILVYISRLC